MIRAEWSFLLSHCGVVRVRHLPAFVSVEPANFCQLSCPECPVGMRHNEQYNRSLMSMDVFQRVLNEVAPAAHTMQFYFQGEPLLNPLLPQMVRLAHEKGLYTIISTNAQALTQESASDLVKAGLNRIIISLDGISEDSYTAYRKGGDLHKVMMGLQYVHDAKEGCKPVIELQMLRLKSNENEWHWLRTHYRKMGADRLTLKTAQFYDYEKGNPLMPSNSRYCRYKKGKDGLYHPKRKIQRPFAVCKRLWMGCVITTCGDVLPCCYDKSGKYAFGNILTSSLSELFHSEKANHFRRQVLTHGESIAICQNCER